MNRCYLVLFLILGAFVKLQAADADSVSIQKKMVDNNAATNHFFSLVHANPAMKYWQYDHSLTEVKGGWEYRNEEEPLIVQEGDGLNFFGVDVDSYIRLKNSSLWGSASYKNGTKTNIKWNETSDFSLVYPYVMGDTIGGDLKSEEYFFSGGYAHETKSFILGVDASYRATIEYRNVDPRPKNFSADLDFTFGAALKLKDGYAVGISAHANKYKQTNDLKFYHVLGASTVYHFTGLGMDYVRFQGNKYNTYYKGKTFGGSLDLLSRRKTGFAASVSYDYFTFEKIISSLNELPMAEIDEHTIKAEAGYRKQTEEQNWGIKMEGRYIRREGTENIFGDAANGIYPQIASMKQYSNNTKQLSLEGLYEQKVSEQLSWTVLPSVNYSYLDMQYVYPSRKLEADRLISSLALRLRKSVKHYLFQVEAHVAYTAAFNPEIQLSETTAGDASLGVLLHNYNYLSTNNTCMGIKARMDYAFSKNYTLFLETRWQHGWYTEKMKTDHVTLNIGVVF